METQVKEKGNIDNLSKPKFIDKKLLQKEQVNDPDYRLKSLGKLYGTKYPITCTRCHHCR